MLDVGYKNSVNLCAVTLCISVVKITTELHRVLHRVEMDGTQIIMIFYDLS